MADLDPGGITPRLSRRRALAAGLTFAGAGLLSPGRGPSGSRPARAAQATPVAAGVPAQPAAIVAIARQAMADLDLRAVILRVTIDGREIITTALGESMTGVPATVDMHFRNGAVAIAYVTTALLTLVDAGKIGLDDPVATWLPDLPQTEGVTLRMLANMTSGYPDYVQSDDFVAAIYADPFRAWTPQELIDFAISKPHTFPPGTNWDYAHTNIVILGLALEQISGMSLADLLRATVLEPLGLSETRGFDTAVIPEPVLHSFSSERRQALGMTDPAIRFSEETTYWDPSWTLARGSVQISNIFDAATSIEAIGRGTLLSPESHQAQIESKLLGFGEPLAGCPTCHKLDEVYNYGLGVVRSGGWILQNPLFAGCGGVAGYLPSRGITVAVASTFGEGSFDDQGNYRNGTGFQRIFVDVAKYLAPDEPPLISG